MTVSKAKKEESLKHLVDMLNKYPIVGVVNMENLPAAQLANMRSKLRESVVLFMTKKRIINLAFAQVKDKQGIDQLKEKIRGMPAILLTNENPFKVSKIIRKSKSKAPAKPGQTAPSDIVISAGPTQFPPGPIISDLGSIGLKTGVENGKVAVKEDKTVVKEGEVISAKLASVLGKLGVEPMEIGLDLIAVLENGIVYGKDVLSVDEQFYIDELKRAASESLNVSVFVGYANKDNIEALIRKAQLGAMGVNEKVGDLDSADAKPAENKQEAPAENKEETPTENKEDALKEEPKEEKPEEKPDKDQ